MIVDEMYNTVQGRIYCAIAKAVINKDNKGMLEYYLYRFKQWLGSVSRELQNRKLEDIPYDGENGSY